ncbi:MAG: hypothetical protein K2I23_01080 [Clostridia bacterium]|nr:hypothetical protein [Clostridia bacterium]
MKKYFEVVAKCGHVGRRYYYEGHFFVAAQCASNAAQAIKNVPRVKHNHSDAILWTKEINYDEYVRGCIAMENNLYFKVKKPKDQAEIWDLIKQDVYPETRSQIEYRDKHSKSKKRDKNINESKYGYRKYYKYMKIQFKYNYDYNNYEEVA